MLLQRITPLLLGLYLLLPLTVNATNGMNLEGYGPIALGMGGASMAYDNGTAAVINNPATLALSAEGRRADLAAGFLGPDVNSSSMGTDWNSGGDAYYMPAFGWATKQGDTSWGVALFAQGGRWALEAQPPLLLSPPPRHWKNAPRSASAA